MRATAQMISLRPVLPDTLISRYCRSFILKQCHMLPHEVQRLCAVPHACIGHDQHIVTHEVAHVCGLACLACIDPAWHLADQCARILHG